MNLSTPRRPCSSYNTMSNWSCLCEDILLLILKEITNLSDYIRFSSVCASWRSVAKQDLCRRRYQLPGLIIPGHRHSTNTTTQTSRFQPVTGINHRRHQQSSRLPPLSAPDHTITRCCGSHQGWLVTMDHPPDMAMHVLNPVTGIQYDLPHVGTLPLHAAIYNNSGWAVIKVVLSSSPSTVLSDCKILLIYGGGALAFCRLGNYTWTSIHPTIQGDGPFGHVDAICYREQFYVVHSSGTTFVCEFSPFQRLRVTGLADFHRLEKRYLVESGGELLRVLRIHDHGYSTVGFEVYKLDSVGNKWVRVRNLGQYALFLGLNQSLSLSESDVPGIRGNCLYFLHDYSRYIQCSGRDMGVWNLGDSTIEPLYPAGLASAELPAVWFTPMPW